MGVVGGESRARPKKWCNSQRRNAAACPRSPPWPRRALFHGKLATQHTRPFHAVICGHGRAGRNRSRLLALTVSSCRPIDRACVDSGCQFHSPSRQRHAVLPQQMGVPALCHVPVVGFNGARVAVVSGVPQHGFADNFVASGFVGAVGGTPLLRLRALSEKTGCNVLGKAEFMNPGQGREGGGSVTRACARDVARRWN